MGDTEIGIAELALDFGQQQGHLRGQDVAAHRIVFADLKTQRAVVEADEGSDALRRWRRGIFGKEAVKQDREHDQRNRINGNQRAAAHQAAATSKIAHGIDG